ncbi:MAG: hypothetical protein C4520_18090 [Candidatus Abyssobacteria bacterium SURF_5]|uniref:Uncharacterized protein n=1 Tax=Abyssobacteria bacterium (strain SURF_5) TaxID=2093360 RepID=A0A3A4N427_ABYX5|nr:MAG: hypothetical protein C4520_18090 [Candidatus Abyssubacteria bacterium SURF_5]
MPRRAIENAWTDVEKAIFNLSDFWDYDDPQNDEYPVPSWTIGRLKKNGLLSPDLAYTYEDLGRVYNLMQSHPEMAVTSREALVFLQWAEQVSKALIQIAEQNQQSGVQVQTKNSN